MRSTCGVQFRFPLSPQFKIELFSVAIKKEIFQCNGEKGGAVAQSGAYLYVMEWINFEQDLRENLLNQDYQENLLNQDLQDLGYFQD